MPKTSEAVKKFDGKAFDVEIKIDKAKKMRRGWPVSSRSRRRLGRT
ncbi:MAG: hypothetical protein MZU95_17495 [Desulfomicrobium escambiense]|nr:hypothetical protein [Desulfomicrobium escambiense]